MKVLSSVASSRAATESAFVVVFTSWDVERIITVEGEVVEDGSFRASSDARVLALHADVEEAAVIGLDVPSMVESLAVGVNLGGIGASETVSKLLNSNTASGSDLRVLPLAGTGKFIKD